MAVLVGVCFARFACDQHHVTKLCTVRSHRLQCLRSSLLWSADGVRSTCGSPCRCMRGSQQCDAEHAARRSQRQGPAAPKFGCVYGHGAMLKPLGEPRGGAGARGRISKCGPHGVTRHALQHSQRAPPSPLTQVRDSYGCIELRMNGIRSGDKYGRELKVRPWGGPHPRFGSLGTVVSGGENKKMFVRHLSKNHCASTACHLCPL
jgi:hypothetical protein